MTPYCPTPQHLLHMEEVEEGVNLLSLKTLVNQHFLDTYILFLITLRRSGVS